jgi:D-alanyl-D-alanine carboxypeptidase
MVSQFDFNQLNHSRRDFVKGAAALMVSPLLGCGSGSGSAQSTNTNAELKTLLNKAWDSRYPGKKGGLTLHMIAPNGEFFASSMPNVGTDSYFRGASITKTFTAAGIMLLDQRGQLRIDDYLTDVIPAGGRPYLPNASEYDIPYKSQITIRHLLEHLAGVFDLANQIIPSTVSQPYAGSRYVDWKVEVAPNHSFTKDELISVVATNQLFDAVPGMTYHYSDTDYTILGKIIEVVSGVSLNEFMRREFLVPNALDQTSFIVSGSNQMLEFPYIEGHSLESGVEMVVTNYNYSYDPASGNLVTTTSNLVRWIRNLIKGQTNLSADQVARMSVITPPATNYGLGILHNKGVGYDLGWGHNGGCGGYLTDAYHDPITDISYVLQSSLIDLSDLSGEFNWMAQTAIDARKTIGY